jgi:hypothetical protein
MNIQIFLFLILIVHSQTNDLFSNLAIGGSASSNTLNQCVEISNARPCATMPWNMTIFPNLLGHTRAEGNKTQFLKKINLKKTTIFLFIEADYELALYVPLFNINCSKSLKYFLCSVYTPICSPLPTCKNLVF